MWVSLSSPVITGQVPGHQRRDNRAPAESASAVLAHGVLEELYRRRGAIGFAFALLLCLLAAAVGLRVWGTDATSATALDGPAVSVSNASSDPVGGGPSGTWQRWGDLDSEKRSQRPVSAPSGTSTTTFSDVEAAPGAASVGATTTTTGPGSS